MNQQDQNFLAEYHFFTAHHGSTVARLLVARMRELRAKLGGVCTHSENIAFGDELAHLLAHLHVLNYMQVEAACALLYALVNRDKGIVPSVLRFDPKEHASFVDDLKQGRVSLRDVGIQVPDALAATTAARTADAYLQKRLRDLAAILSDTDVRRSYNKLKHCGIVVRSAQLLASDDRVEGVEANSVSIPTTTSTPKKYAPHSLPLTPDDQGVPPEEKYLKDITFFGRLLAEFVKQCTGQKEPERGEQHGGQISSEGASSAPPNESSP